MEINFMTFIEFKKNLLDADLTLPKFSRLIKISDKNLQSYKKKDKVPNPIAVNIACFVAMKKAGIDYAEIVEQLNLELKTKTGGFKKKNH